MFSHEVMKEVERVIDTAHHLQKDDQMDSYIKKIGETHLNAKIQTLEELLKEFEHEDSTIMNYPIVIVKKNLEILKSMKGEGSE